MPKFRRKPVVIEAEQFFPDKKPWPKEVSYRFHVPDYWNSPGLNTYQIMEVWMGPRSRCELYGPNEVRPGDYIMTDAHGNHYPVNPDIFEATYELVEVRE